MIEIEKRKLQLLEIEHAKMLVYLERKTEYYGQLLAERRNFAPVGREQNNLATIWPQQWYPLTFDYFADFGTQLSVFT